MARTALLTPRGRWSTVLGLLLLLGGGLARYPVLAALGAALLLLVGAEAFGVRRARGLRVERTIEPSVVVRGEPCRGHVRVLGRLRRGLIRTDAADLVAGALVPVPLTDESGRRAAEATYDVPTRRRGLHQVGPVQLRHHGLAGMAAKSISAGDTVPLRVLPRRVPVRAMLAGHRRWLSSAGEAVELGGTDLVDLREYSLGDDIRRLHWATSARTGTLMVREDADPSDPHVSVVLDDRAEAYPDDPDQFEDAVEFAAALCRIAAERGNPLRLSFTSAREPVSVAGSPTGVPRRESQDIEWLLSELQPVDDGALSLHPGRDLDIAVIVTGPGRDLRPVSASFAAATTGLACIVDRTASVGATHDADLLVLSAANSHGLADLWDRMVTT